MIRVIYQDSYGNLLYRDDTTVLPRLGDEVILPELENYRVKNVAWHLSAKEVLITLAEDQLPGIKKEKSENFAPLRYELDSLKESVSRQEKKTRFLGDSLQSLNNRVKSTEINNRKNDTR